jgi:uncharacterized protein (DUF305 family)
MQKYLGQGIHSGSNPPLVADTSGADGTPFRCIRRRLYSPPSTRSSVLQLSQADVAFMQRMIMHYFQAMEMTAMIPSHMEHKDVQDFGQIRSGQNGMVKSAPATLTTIRESPMWDACTRD